MRGSYENNPALMISHIFERQKEIESINNPLGLDQPKTQTDPFFLLRETMEMTKYMGQTNGEARDGLSMKQEENMQNYSNMIESNFVKQYDPASIEAKMAKFKFAKRDNSQSSEKKSDWFSQIGKVTNSQETATPTPVYKMKFGLTKEDEIQIQQDMIPSFIAKQQELRPQYEHVKQVGREVEELRVEMNLKKIPSVKPDTLTSFMPKMASQAKEYEMMTEPLRKKKLQQAAFKKSLSPSRNAKRVQIQTDYNKPLQEICEKPEKESKNSPTAKKSQKDASTSQVYNKKQQVMSARKQSQLSSRLSQHKDKDNIEDHPEVKKIKEEFDKIMVEQRAMINFTFPKPNQNAQKLDSEHRPRKKLFEIEVQKSKKRHASNLKFKQQRTQKVVDDDGNEYVIDNTGLIDRNKTEKLFNRRHSIEKDSMAIEIEDQGELQLKIQTIPVLTEQDDFPESKQAEFRETVASQMKTQKRSANSSQLKIRLRKEDNHSIADTASILKNQHKYSDPLESEEFQRKKQPKIFNQQVQKANQPVRNKPQEDKSKNGLAISSQGFFKSAQTQNIQKAFPINNGNDSSDAATRNTKFNNILSSFDSSNPADVAKAYFNSTTSSLLKNKKPSCQYDPSSTQNSALGAIAVSQQKNVMQKNINVQVKNHQSFLRTQHQQLAKTYGADQVPEDYYEKKTLQVPTPNDHQNRVLLAAGISRLSGRSKSVTGHYGRTSSCGSQGPAHITRFANISPVLQQYASGVNSSIIPKNSSFKYGSQPDLDTFDGVNIRLERIQKIQDNEFGYIQNARAVIKNSLKNESQGETREHSETNPQTIDSQSKVKENSIFPDIKSPLFSKQQDRNKVILAPVQFNIEPQSSQQLKTKIQDGPINFSASSHFEKRKIASQSRKNRLVVRDVHIQDKLGSSSVISPAKQSDNNIRNSQNNYKSSTQKEARQRNDSHGIVESVNKNNEDVHLKKGIMYLKMEKNKMNAQLTRINQPQPKTVFDFKIKNQKNLNNLIYNKMGHLSNLNESCDSQIDSKLIKEVDKSNQSQQNNPLQINNKKSNQIRVPSRQGSKHSKRVFHAQTKQQKPLSNGSIFFKDDQFDDTNKGSTPSTFMKELQKVKNTSEMPNTHGNTTPMQDKRQQFSNSGGSFNFNAQQNLLDKIKEKENNLKKQKKKSKNDNSQKELKSVKSSIFNLNLNHVMSPLNNIQKPKQEQKSELASLLSSTRNNFVLSARPSQDGNISENIRYNNGMKMPSVKEKRKNISSFRSSTKKNLTQISLGPLSDGPRRDLMQSNNLYLSPVNALKENTMSARHQSFTLSQRVAKTGNSKKLRQKLVKLSQPKSPINFSMINHGKQASLENDHIAQIKYALLNLDTDSLKDINETQNSIYHNMTIETYDGNNQNS